VLDIFSPVEKKSAMNMAIKMTKSKTQNITSDPDVLTAHCDVFSEAEACLSSGHRSEQSWFKS
jgi:hypothetical protein